MDLASSVDRQDQVTVRIPAGTFSQVDTAYDLRIDDAAGCFVSFRMPLSCP